MRFRRNGGQVVTALGLTLVLLLVGCDDNGGARTAEVEPNDGSGDVTVVAQESSFDVERIEVEAGTTTTIRLENRDAVTHTLTVYVGGSTEGAVAASTGEVTGGETGETVVFFAGAGEHAFHCEIHPDRMQGVLVAR